MKKIFIFAALILMVSCNCKKNNEKCETCGEDSACAKCDDKQCDDAVCEEAETEALQTADSPFKTKHFSKTAEKGLWSFSLEADYPESGNETLMSNIRNYINKSLCGDDDECAERSLYKGDIADVEAMFEHYKTAFIKECDDAESHCSEQHSFTVEWENENLVTYEFMADYYMGGAHPTSYSGGVTFRKSDGHLFAKDILKKGANLNDIIKKELKEHFEVSTDEELNEVLQEGTANKIPLPKTMWVDKQGLHLKYQSYEIACYAAGAPGFTIPLAKAKQYLSPEVLKNL